jgi:hypothetical protein
VDDYMLIDTNGGYHSADNCCCPAYTVEEIEKYFRDDWASKPEFLKEYCINWEDDKLPLICQALLDGKRICDDQGIVLPEFKK